MQWGPKQGARQSDGEWLSKIAAQTGARPTAVVSRPQLHPHELPYWDAFNTLHLSRANTGFGPGAIPLSEIVTYAELMEMPTGEVRQEFVAIMRAMDGAYLTLRQEPRHV